MTAVDSTHVRFTENYSPTSNTQNDLVAVEWFERTGRNDLLGRLLDAEVVYEVSEDELKAVREDAEAEGVDGAEYYVEVLRPRGDGNQPGDRIWLDKDVAEREHEQGLVTEPIKVRGGDDPKVQEAEQRQRERESEIREIGYGTEPDIRTVAAQVGDEVDGKPESRSETDLREFVLKHWKAYARLKGDGAFEGGDDE